jgi:hypothetical protein
LNAQQCVPLLSPAQSDAAVHNLTVKVSGLRVEPQVAPGRFSAHVAWQLEVKDATEQEPTNPPSRTSVPQQTVPAPQPPGPLLPGQSNAKVVPVHVEEQLSANELLSRQQCSPALHVIAPPWADAQVGASHVPAPWQATLHGGPSSCQLREALHDWRCSGPLQRVCPGVQVPPLPISSPVSTRTSAAASRASTAPSAGASSASPASASEDAPVGESTATWAMMRDGTDYRPPPLAVGA